MRNQLGYPTLSAELLTKIGLLEEPGEAEELVESPISNMKERYLRKQLEEFGVDLSIAQGSLEIEVDDIEGVDLPKFTELDGFAEELCIPKIQIIDKLLRLSPSEVRTDWTKFKFRSDLGPGWNRLDCETHTISHLEIEDLCGQAIIIDTETFVKDNPEFHFPIMATLIASDGTVGFWCHPCLLRSDSMGLMESMFEFTHMTVPVPSRDCVLIAHNCGYDRPRVDWHPTNVWLDTMSMHINVSGVLSEQRLFYTASEERFPVKPYWFKHGCLNNLIDCYNFHVGKKKRLSKKDKKQRDIFITAEKVEDFLEEGVFVPSIAYAIKDVVYTLELFQKLFPKYIENNPSMSTLYAHFVLTRTRIPVAPDWNEWVVHCDEMFEKAKQEQSTIFKVLSEDLLAEGYSGKEITANLDWSTTTRGKFKGIPRWFVPVYKGDTITTKSSLAHILLRLRWENQVIYHTKEFGYCYRDEKNNEHQIPHPDGVGKNVGCILTGDFIIDAEKGTLTTDLPEGKELLVKILKLSESIAYWTSVRSRVRGQITHNLEPSVPESLWLVPSVLPHNTSTNRVGDNLWLTVPGAKHHKIGSEIKSKIQAPEGYCLLYTDVDSEEAMIAAIYGDSIYGVSGATPFSFSLLAGSKATKTDMHSITAQLVGISRGIAKNLNYGLFLQTIAHIKPL